MDETSDEMVIELYSEQPPIVNISYEVKVEIDGRTFDKTKIFSIVTDNQLCDLKFEIGKTACGTITLEILKPSYKFAKMARIIPWYRRNDEAGVGAWKKKGVYYIDTRKNEINGDNETLVITGFDGMLKTSKDYGNLNLTYPATTKSVVQKIASLSGISVASETLTLLGDGQTIPEPEYLTGREILEGIAAMYGGSFMMSSDGYLTLVDMAEVLAIEEAERLLATENWIPIEIGGVVIVV